MRIAIFIQLFFIGGIDNGFTRGISSNSEIITDISLPPLDKISFTF
jgi:hypothetical protein